MMENTMSLKKHTKKMCRSIQKLKSKIGRMRFNANNITTTSNIYDIMVKAQLFLSDAETNLSDARSNIKETLYLLQSMEELGHNFSDTNTNNNNKE